MVWGSAALTLQRARFTLTTLRGDRSQEELDGFISATEGTSDGALQAIRAECFGILAEQTLVTGDVRAGMGLIGRAKRELVDPSDREAARLLLSTGLVHHAALDLGSATESFAQALELSRVSGDRWSQATLWARLALTRFMTGDLDGAGADIRAGLEVATTVGKWSESSVCHAVLASIAATRGDCGAAADHAQRAIRLLVRSDYGISAPLAYGALTWACSQRGDVDGARATVLAWGATGQRGLDSYFVLIGDDCEVPPADRRVPKRLSLGTLPIILAAAAEAVRTREHALAERVAAHISAIRQAGVIFVAGWPFDVPSVAADIAVMLE